MKREAEVDWGANTRGRSPLPAALVDEDIGAAFVVKDGAGQKLAQP